MLYSQINGFGVFRSRLCFKVRAKILFFFIRTQISTAEIKRQPQAASGFSDNLPLSLSGERILLKRIVLFILCH